MSAAKRAKLAPKHRRFCDEYLIDLNAAAAARRAGFSKRSAAQLGMMLLKRADVQQRITELMAERESASRVKAFRVLEEVAALAYSSIDHYVISGDGKVTLAPGAPEDAMRAVASVQRRVRLTPRGGDQKPIVHVTTELRLWDKPTVLRIAAQHLGMLRNQVDVRDLTLEQYLRSIAPDTKGEDQ